MTVDPTVPISTRRPIAVRDAAEKRAKAEGFRSLSAWVGHLIDEALGNGPHVPVPGGLKTAKVTKATKPAVTVQQEKPTQVRKPLLPPGAPIARRPRLARKDVNPIPKKGSKK